MTSILEQTALVVEADVTDISNTYDEVTGPRTVTALSNITVHLGTEKVPETILLRSFGGPLPDGRRVDEAHVPTFVRGQRYLLFLRNGDWRFSPVAGDQVFRVERVAGKPILVTGAGDSVQGVSATGPVPGFPVYLQQPDGYPADETVTVNPALDGAMVKRAQDVREFVTALRAYSNAEGISVGGTFPEAPTTDGPSWRIVRTSAGTSRRQASPTAPTAETTGLLDDLATLGSHASIARALTADELLTCFEEPVTRSAPRDSTPEELPVCIGGEQ